MHAWMLSCKMHTWTAHAARGPRSAGLVEYRSSPELQRLMWTSVSPLPTARSAAAGATVRDDLFVFGGAECECRGNTAAACPESYSTRAETFNTVTSRWTSVANVPTGRYGAAAASWHNRVYMVGGAVAPIVTAAGFSDVVEAYDAKMQARTSDGTANAMLPYVCTRL